MRIQGESTAAEGRNYFERLSGERVWLTSGALLALVSVFAGAVGSHILKDFVDSDRLATFETAIRFQMFHGLALIAVSLIMTRMNVRSIRVVGWLFTIGVLIFSGSLYIIALTNLKAFGVVAPFGGVCLMAGWALLATASLRK